MDTTSQKRVRANNTNKTNNNNTNNNNTNNQAIKKRAISGNTQVNNSPNNISPTTIVSSSSPNTTSTISTSTAPTIVTASTTITSSVPFYRKPLNEEDIEAIFQAQGEHIAAGGFGKAERVFYRGRSFVRKISLLSREVRSEYVKKVFENEVAILEKLRGDPYFPYLYAAATYNQTERVKLREQEREVTNEYGIIIMEDIGGLDLYELLHTKISTDEKTIEIRGILPYELDVLRALVQQSVRRLHERHGILHLDLKLENILVRMDGNIIVGIVIIDFGYSKFIDDAPNLPIYGTFAQYDEKGQMKTKAFVTTALIKRRLLYGTVKKQGSPNYYKALDTNKNKPYMYKYTVQNNSYALKLTFEDLKMFLTDNVDRGNAINILNRPVLPRFFEDTREQILSNALISIMDLMNNTPDQSDVDFNLSAIRFMRRIIAAPQNTALYLENTQDKSGNTLIHKVLENPEFDIQDLQRVLMLRVDPTLANKAGKTPLMIIDEQIERVTQQLRSVMKSSSSTISREEEEYSELLQLYEAAKTLIQGYIAGPKKGGKRKTRKQRKRS